MTPTEQIFDEDVDQIIEEKRKEEEEEEEDENEGDESRFESEEEVEDETEAPEEEESEDDEDDSEDEEDGESEEEENSQKVEKDGEELEASQDVEMEASQETSLEKPSPEKTKDGDVDAQKTEQKVQEKSDETQEKSNGGEESTESAAKETPPAKETSQPADSQEPQPPAPEEPVQPDDLTPRQRLVRDAGNGDITEIMPFVAIPYGQAVHSLSFTKGPKYMFTGGEDGMVRKYDFFGSVEGEAPLTMAQRHQLVDTISFGGSIVSYWENEQPYYKADLLRKFEEEQAKSKRKSKKPIDVTSITAYDPQMSPVYSLAAQSDAFWVLSGLKSGGIAVQSARTYEGAIQYYFKHGKDKYQHSNAVSCLQLNCSDDKFLSGSWDRKIIEWDLNSGKAITLFEGATGQISSIDRRPVGGVDIPLDQGDDDMDSLFGDDNQDKKPGEDQEPKSDIQKDLALESKTVLQKGRYEGIIRSDDVFLTSSVDGALNIWDGRLSDGSKMVCSVPSPADIAPWCMSAVWSSDGNSIFLGRRNSTVEEYDVRKLSSVKHVMRFPSASGPVSCVRTLPNKDYLLCGCEDNIRLYDLRLSDFNRDQPTSSAADHSHHHKRRRKMPFMIVPGHNGGILSDMYIDPTARFVVSASGNRGWQGKAADYVFIYEIQKAQTQ